MVVVAYHSIACHVNEPDKKLKNIANLSIVDPDIMVTAIAYIHQG